MNNPLENPITRSMEAKDILARFQKRAFVTNPDLDEVVDLVVDLLQLDIDYTSKHEPYAINSLNGMKIAQERIRSLYMVFEEE